MKTMRYWLLLFCAVSVFYAGRAAAQKSLTWSSKFTGTMTYAIGLNPLDNSIIYTTKAGVFQVSHDKGISWQERGSGFPADQVRNITVNPLDTLSIILVGYGVWKSPDGGWTWNETLPNVQIDGESIDYNYQNPNTIYFVDFYNSDFYISTDKGNSWTQRSTVGFGNVCTIGSDPNDSNIILVGAGDTRIARSTDQGHNWSLVKTGNPYFSECPKLVWDKAHPNVVYAAIYLDHNYSFYKSTNAGATWQDMGLYGLYVWGMDADPVSGDIYIGTFGEFSHSGDYNRIGVFRSSDEGRSWQRVGNIIGYPFVNTDMNIWMIKAAADHSVYILNHPEFFDNLGAIYSVNTSGLGAVSGSITSSITGTPIAHANIIVQQTGDSIIVNNTDGTFKFSLPPGTYTLVCKSSGVQQTVSGVVVTSNNVVTQNFQLALDNQVSSMSGTISNALGETISSIVTVHGSFGGGSPFTVSDTVTSVFSFVNLSSLNQYDSIVVQPLTLPYLPKTVTPVALGGNYNVQLQRADVLIINDPDISSGASPGSVYAPLFQGPLVQGGITSVVWNTDELGQSVPVDVVGKTNKTTALWLTRFMNQTIPSSLHDSLTGMVNRGYNLIIAGQNLAELNSGTMLFSSKLKIGFIGDYTASSTVQGFPNNILSDGLNFSAAQGSVNSRDIISLLDTTHAFKAFWYGTSDNTIIGGAYVDNTGNSGKAVFLGFDLRSVTSSVLQTIFKRSLDYFDNSKPFTLTTSVLQNPALSQYIDIVVGSAIPLQSVPTVQIWRGQTTDTSNIALTPVNGSNAIYSGSFTFSLGGTYVIRTHAHSNRDEDSTMTRAFNAVLAKPGNVTKITSVNGWAELQIPSNGVRSETYFLADNYTANDETIYHFGPERNFAQPLAVEINYDGNFVDPEKLFIYQKDRSGWKRLPGTVLLRKHAIKAEVTALGEFKLGYDANAESNIAVIRDFSLRQNYPNPFNPATTIEYDLPEDGRVNLTIYNLLGQKVRTLVSAPQTAGRYRIMWDAKSEQGNAVASGIYLYRLQTGNFVRTKKLILLK